MPERGPERWRLFVALSLPDSVRSEFARWSYRAAGGSAELRLLAEDDLHATLCFLGWVACASVPAVVEALGLVAALPAAPLALGSALWLPRRRPRVLAVSLVDAQGALGRVQAALSGALSAGGWYRPEARDYLAHVTVARVRHGARVRAVSPPAPSAAEFLGRRVTLYRSQLARSGARYEALGEVELAISPGAR